MVNTSPEISIVIPVYNREYVLPDTLESIQKQQFTNWECILVDDHSTDQSQAVCLELTVNDPRFIFLVNQCSKGAPGARNTGILAAKAPFVLLFDSDNLLHADALESLQKSITENNCDVHTCFAQVLNDKGERVSQFHWKCEGNILKDLLTGKSYVDNNLALIRTALLREIGLTDEACPSYQEWDTHIRLSARARYVTIERELVDYIQTQGSISSDQHKSVRGFLYVLEKHREAFSKYPEAHRAFGLELLQTAELIKDARLIAEVHQSLSAAIPQFEKYVRSQKRSAQINGFKHRLKMLFKRPT